MNFKNLLTIQTANWLTVLVLAVCTVLPATFVNAQGFKGQACDSAVTANIDNCNPSGDGEATGNEQGSKVLNTVVNVLSAVVGIASVIMIMVGGFKYLISSGDSAGVQSAKNTILYALVGLVIALFAQGIVRFVLTSIN